MTNPAFIVDGFTELLIIQKLCPNRPIRRTDLNGKDVSLGQIAGRISSLIRALGNKYYPIVIIVDKEKRNIASDKMAEEILAGIKASEGMNNQDIRIGVPDRMIENWILADWETLAGETPKPNDMEGTNGKAEIKKLNGSYGEKTDGPKCFIAARPQEIYKNSRSFRTFVDQILDIDCPYLHFERQIE